MPAPKCPFQSLIITKEFACRLGQEVTARNTPEIHCSSGSALAICLRVNERFKDVGLPAFGMEDDLTSTPHNVYLKIQQGGLRGLRPRGAGPPEDGHPAVDIHDLIDAVTAGGRDTENLPYQELVPAMREQKSRRRGGPRR